MTGPDKALRGPTVFYATYEDVFSSETGMGFHVGSEVTYCFQRHVGAAGSVIFNKGGNDDGFTGFGGGVRVRF
jgi:hypothetical protein